MGLWQRFSGDLQGQGHQGDRQDGGSPRDAGLLVPAPDWRCSRRSSGACSTWPPPGSGWRCRASSCRPRRPSSTSRPSRAMERRPGGPGPGGPHPPGGHRAGAGVAQDPARPAPGRGGEADRGLQAAPGPPRRLPHPQGDDQGHLHRRRGPDQGRRGPVGHLRGDGRHRRWPSSGRRTRRPPCRPGPGRSTSCWRRGRSTTCRPPGDALDAELGRAVAGSPVDAELAKLKAELRPRGRTPKALE